MEGTGMCVLPTRSVTCTHHDVVCTGTVSTPVLVVPIQTWRLLLVPFPLLHLPVVMPHLCQFVSRLFMALSRCLNKQFRGLFTVAILFLIKRVKKEKKSVPGTSRFWELTRRTTYSPSESQSTKQQKTHHAPARFKTFSKAVHRMAVPHFGTFGVALNGFFEFWQEKKKKSTADRQIFLRYVWSTAVYILNLVEVPGSQVPVPKFRYTLQRRKSTLWCVLVRWYSTSKNRGLPYYQAPL